MKNSPRIFQMVTKSSKYLRYISFLGNGVMTVWLLMALNMDSNLGSSTSSEWVNLMSESISHLLG